MNYFKRLRDVLTFLFIWIVIPSSIYYYINDANVFTLLLLTWIPAWLITDYLKDSN